MAAGELAPSSLTTAACSVLTAADPNDKVRLSRQTAAAWLDGDIADLGDSTPPDRPARPSAPELRAPKDVPRRRIGSGLRGRVALLHALAHIELNAIDLAWDLIARFASDPRLPRAFYDDWVRVAAEEAEHFALLRGRMSDLDAAYGDLPAHDGLWEAAQATAGDLLARLAVVPMVLEARGLDVTPQMIKRLRQVEDHASADILQTIHDDEIGHVAVGRKWFEHCCRVENLDPVAAFQSLVRRYFRGQLKPPFNEASRNRAGFTPDYYEPLVQRS